jgi:hypothetical protein
LIFVKKELLTRMGIELKKTSKKEKVFCGIFFREVLPEKIPPAEQPTKCIWAYQ